MSGGVHSSAARPGTAVVIGASGFIGSRLFAALTAAGARPTGFTSSDPLCRDGSPVSALRGARTAYFAAGSITPATAELHPARVTDHLAFFRSFLDQLTVSGTRPRVVLASSGGTVYDPGRPPPYTERSPVAPATAYGRAKLQMEEELLARSGALTPVVLRLSNVYGPGQRLGTGQGVVAHWLDAAANGRPLTVYGPPEYRRDYVYVDDVVAAMTAVHQAGPLPEVLNIGSGQPVSLAGLLAVVRAVAARRDLAVRFEAARRFDRRDIWLDSGLARRALGWTASTSLADGIRVTWQAHLRALQAGAGSPR
jgi:UDP-glucose 4-epimerase